jgi:hypothetical protein
MASRFRCASRQQHGGHDHRSVHEFPLIPKGKKQARWLIGNSPAKPSERNCSMKRIDSTTLANSDPIKRPGPIRGRCRV